MSKLLCFFFGHNLEAVTYSDWEYWMQDGEIVDGTGKWVEVEAQMCKRCRKVWDE